MNSKWFIFKMNFTIAIFIYFVFLYYNILFDLSIFLFCLEKYDYVGRLLKPGEPHSYYTDEEETPTNKLHLENPKQCESEKPKNYAGGDSTDINELPKTETKDNNKETVDNNSTGSLSSDSNDEKPEATKILDNPTKQDEIQNLEN